MAHKSNARGTLRIDRRYRGVGRLAMSSGTTDERMHALYSGMLDALYEAGRLDLLRAVKERQLPLRELWDAYRPAKGKVVDLSRLPTPESLRRLWTLDDAGQEAGAIAQWLTDFDAGEEHKRDTARRLGHLQRLAGGAATIADLPALLLKYRKAVLARAKQPRVLFNAVRTSCLAFLRSAAGHRSALYLAISDIEPLKFTRKATRGLTPDEARRVCAALAGPTQNLAYGEAFWALCVTGMRPREYFGHAWRVTADGIVVERSKTEAGKRTIPLVDRSAVAAAPTITFGTFRQRVYALQAGTRPFTTPFAIPVTSYQARRTFAQWMEAAGVPRSRRRLYLGHAAGDVTEIYERAELAQYRREDAARVRAFLGLDDTTGLRLVSGGSHG